MNYELIVMSHELDACYKVLYEKLFQSAAVAFTRRCGLTCGADRIPYYYIHHIYLI